MGRAINTARWYAFERAVRGVCGNGPEYPLCRLRALVHQATLAHRVRVIGYVPRRLMVDITRGACVWLRGGKCIIVCLPPSRRHAWTALHEAAHVLAGPMDGHGGGFPRYALQLWLEAGVWPRATLLALAARHNYSWEGESTIGTTCHDDHLTPSMCR